MSDFATIRQRDNDLATTCDGDRADEAGLSQITKVRAVRIGGPIERIPQVAGGHNSTGATVARMRLSDTPGLPRPCVSATAPDAVPSH